jgi:hypothetical protein
MTSTQQLKHAIVSALVATLNKVGTPDAKTRAEKLASSFAAMGECDVALDQARAHARVARREQQPDVATAVRSVAVVFSFLGDKYPALLPDGCNQANGDSETLARQIIASNKGSDDRVVRAACAGITDALARQGGSTDQLLAARAEVRKRSELVALAKLDLDAEIALAKKALRANTSAGDALRREIAPRRSSKAETKPAEAKVPAAPDAAPQPRTGVTL